MTEESRNDPSPSAGVGVLGAGRMGTPIIGHLVRGGFPTFVFDPNPARRADVEARGATMVTNPLELASHCSTILVCVGFEHELVAALTGPAGLFAALAPRSVVAVVSTVSPERVVSLAEEGAKHTVDVIDATVCRGGEWADRGDLLCFVGGDREVLARVQPVLSTYCSDIVHVGSVGSGQVAKAVNNLILWACLVADHEGLALAQRYGLDLDALRSALLISSAANDALTNWGRQTMAWAEDDLRIVTDMAMKMQVSLPQSGLNRELCRSLKPRRYQLEEYGR